VFYGNYFEGQKILSVPARYVLEDRRLTNAGLPHSPRRRYCFGAGCASASTLAHRAEALRKMVQGARPTKPQPPRRNPTLRRTETGPEIPSTSPAWSESRLTVVSPGKSQRHPQLTGHL